MHHPNSHLSATREMLYHSSPADSQKLFDLFTASLEEYEKQAGIALSKHPLAEQLRYSDSAETVIAILQEQVLLVPASSEFGGTDRITKSLCSIVSVTFTLSVSLDLSWPWPLAEPIYAGFAILLATVKDVSALEPLVDLLESIESVLKHLDICAKVPHTAAMTETVVETLVELLSILGLVTKFVKQGMFVEGNFDQMVLERLDRLTLDERRITALQILKVVYGLVQSMSSVMGASGKKPSIDSIWDALEVMHHIVSAACDVNKSKRDKLQQDIQNWLSPPDPSINHKTACELRHTGTTAWFFRGDTYLEWKCSKTCSLLWIHGKPGAGKTILCSTIIQYIDTMRRAGLVSLAYYYCDFRDDKKKDLRGLVSSLLVQLCHQSDSYCDMVSKFYLKYAKGSVWPSDAALELCLKGLLKLPGQTPVYLIVDALDECPTTSDMPPVQDKVLMLVRQLTISKYPNLRICVTSRLEPDLGVVLEPLPFRSISLHDESGQKEDIASYIYSVIHTDPKMQAWSFCDKELVINVLTHKVDGIFQWASCQIAYLRHCPRERIQRTLDDLPETLDGTYRRTLRDIDKADRAFAHRLFSCVSVARRPLRTEELAELLAFYFKGGPFRLFRRGWRQEDLVNAVQTKFSSLLGIAEDGGTTIIQFSHFSVQEFFENEILANASANVSYYHIPMASTHTVVAQACLDVLLRLDENVFTRDTLRAFPLADYAAEHWVNHVRFGNVWQNVEDKVKHLFDPRKPHFAAYLWIYGPELPIWIHTERAERPSLLAGTALHYAALWGLHAIVKFLVIERSQDVQATGFAIKMTPLCQAAKWGHVEVARFLINHGADVNFRDINYMTSLHLASREGQLEVARLLIDHGAVLNARNVDGLTPLHLASQEGQLGVVRFLIDHSVVVNARNVDGSTPLHLASRWGQLEVARIQGAVVNNARDMDSATPLHLASREGQLAVARFLIDHGADVHARDMNRSTPLHLALREGQLGVARLLIAHGADVHARDPNRWTPLHLASREGELEVVRFLINHGADVNVGDKDSFTPLHLASREGQLAVARFLIIHNADVDGWDMDRSTPLHLASRVGQVKVARLLIDHGADVNARDMCRSTPLHLASREGRPEVARILLEQGADSDARDNDNCTPLHWTSQLGHLKVARVLLEHGTDVNSGDISNWTPLHGASQNGHSKVAHFLLSRGANVHASDLGGWTPLQLPSRNGDLGTVQVLLEHGADTNTRDNNGWTPLHCASRWGHRNVVQILLKHGADANARDNNNWTPLHCASQWAHPEVVPLLLKHRADVNSRADGNQTALHLASRAGYQGIVQLLVWSGADIHVRNDEGRTAFEEASVKEHRNIMQLLLQYEARNEGV